MYNNLESTVLVIVFYSVYLNVQYFGKTFLLIQNCDLQIKINLIWIGITSAHPAGHSHLPFNQLVEMKHHLKKGNTVKSSLNRTQVTCVIHYQINFWYIYNKSLQISSQPNKPHSVDDLENLLASAWEHLEQRATLFTQKDVVTFKRFVKQ